MRKYHFMSQMGFLVAMLSYLLDDAIANVPVFRDLAYTGIVLWAVLGVAYFFVNEIKYLLLVKELGLQAIVFYYVYQTGGIMTCGGIILVGIIPVFTSLVFKNYKWIVLSFTAYFISVSYLAIVDEHLPGKDFSYKVIRLLPSSPAKKYREHHPGSRQKHAAYERNV